MALKITPSVWQLLLQNFKPDGNKMGYLIGAMGKDENVYSNTALVTEEITDLILGVGKYEGLIKYLNENKNSKIMPWFNCNNLEDGKKTLQDLSKIGFGLCIFLTKEKPIIHFYIVENGRIKKEKVEVTSRMDDYSSKEIDRLMDYMIKTLQG